MNKKYYYFSQASDAEEVSESGANMRNVEIFRVGEFHGGAVKFTKKDLREMVQNFIWLKKEAILPNVPVRADHPGFLSGGSVDKIIGYIEDIRLKGEKLVADFRITEPDAMEKIKRGTYRSRSIELGMYVDNSGDEYYPAVMGLAFVDLPAVEGLADNYQTAFSQDSGALVLNQEEFARWTRAFINQLPDSSFAAIEPAYKRGESKDKNARHLPYRNEDGEVDVPHLRNALARVNQITPITDSISAKELRAQALKELKKHRGLLKEKAEGEAMSLIQAFDAQIADIMAFNQLTNEDMNEEENTTPVQPEVPSEEEKKEEEVVETTPVSEETKPEAEETPAEGVSEEGTPEEGEPAATEGEPEAPAEGQPTDAQMSLKKDMVMMSRSELEKLQSQAQAARKLEFAQKVESFKKAGKSTPATSQMEAEFMMALEEASPELLAQYEALKEKQPKFFELGDVTETPQEDSKPQATEGGELSDAEAEAQAEALLKEE